MAPLQSIVSYLSLMGIASAAVAPKVSSAAVVAAAPQATTVAAVAPASSVVVVAASAAASPAASAAPVVVAAPPQSSGAAKASPAVPAASPVAPAGSTAPKAPTGSNGSTGGSSAATKQLQLGVQLAQIAQQGELAAVNDLLTLAKGGSTIDATTFKAAKANLIAFISAGSVIRQNSLLFANGDAQVTRTLAQIEQEQVIELSLANNLTGTSSTDMPLLTQLNTSLQKVVQDNKSLQTLAGGKTTGNSNGKGGSGAKGGASNQPNQGTGTGSANGGKVTPKPAAPAGGSSGGTSGGASVVAASPVAQASPRSGNTGKKDNGELGRLSSH